MPGIGSFQSRSCVLLFSRHHSAVAAYAAMFKKNGAPKAHP
jgi:hypothetical protein